MTVLIVNKIPLLKMMRGFFTLQYGIVDYDELLDCLCSGINGSAGKDRLHVRNMVYGDAWTQDPETYTEDQKTRMLRFLHELRSTIVREIHHHGRAGYHLHFRYLLKSTTRMSLKFEVYE